jgi:methyl-accepting chemotaxis protein
VVADEVRKLAERTALSTRDIADMIASIRTDTNAVTERMGAAIANPT